MVLYKNLLLTRTMFDYIINLFAYLLAVKKIFK